MKIGKAGNPDIMDNVDIIIGATTDIISAEGKIITAGGIDITSIVNPEQSQVALKVVLQRISVVGQGASEGASKLLLPRPWHLHRMLLGSRIVTFKHWFYW